MTLEGRLFFMFVVELVLPNFVIENIFIGFVNSSTMARSCGERANTGTRRRNGQEAFSRRKATENRGGTHEKKSI